MTDNRDKVLRRIRKLLAVAEGKANIHESATAAEMAAKLMAKYNVERSDVLLREMGSDDIISHCASDSRKTVPLWMNRLGVSVARAYDCESCLDRDGQGRLQIAFLGYRDDTLIADWVFTFLIHQIDYLSKKYRREKRKQLGARNGTNMTAYRDGLLREIQVTLKAIADAKKTATSGKELMVMKNQMIRQKFQVSYSSGRQRVSGKDAGTYEDGRSDGRKVNIGTPVGRDSQPLGLE